MRNATTIRRPLLFAPSTIHTFHILDPSSSKRIYFQQHINKTMGFLFKKTTSSEISVLPTKPSSTSRLVGGGRGGLLLSRLGRSASSSSLSSTLKSTDAEEEEGVVFAKPTYLSRPRSSSSNSLKSISNHSLRQQHHQQRAENEQSLSGKSWHSTNSGTSNYRAPLARVRSLTTDKTASSTFQIEFDPMAICVEPPSAAVLPRLKKHHSARNLLQGKSSSSNNGFDIDERLNRRLEQRHNQKQHESVDSIVVLPGSRSSTSWRRPRHASLTNLVSPFVKQQQQPSQSGSSSRMMAMQKSSSMRHLSVKQVSSHSSEQQQPQQTGRRSSTAMMQKSNSMRNIRSNSRSGGSISSQREISHSSSSSARRPPRRVNSLGAVESLNDASNHSIGGRKKPSRRVLVEDSLKAHNSCRRPPRRGNSAGELLNATSTHSSTSGGRRDSSKHHQSAPPPRRVNSLGDLDEMMVEQQQREGRIRGLRERRQKSAQVLEQSRRRAAPTTSREHGNATWSSSGMPQQQSDNNNKSSKRRGLISTANSRPPSSITLLRSFDAIDQGRQLVQKVMENNETVQQVKLAMPTTGEVDNCQVMEEAIKQIRAQLFKIQLDKSEELCRMRHDFEARKLEIQAEVTQKYQKVVEQAEQLQWEQLDAEQELASLELENKDLQKDHERLLVLVKEVAEEQKVLEEEAAKIQAQHESLTAYVNKKTIEKGKLVAAEQNLATIYRGAVALLIEPGVKDVYRNYMYKCARSVNVHEGKESPLYEDVMGIIGECEWELGNDILVDATTTLVDAEARALPNSRTKSTKVTSLSAHFFHENLAVVEEGENEDATLNDNVDVQTLCDDVQSFCEDAGEAKALVDHMSSKLSSAQITTLYENKDMLLTIFKFLDTDGSGKIDRGELKVGIDLLNKRLPLDAQFEDYEVLFDALDVDKDGGIDLEEFNNLFSNNQVTN